MAVRVPTTCSRDRKMKLERIARAIGKTQQDTLDLAIDAFFEIKKRAIIKIEQTLRTAA